MGSHQESEAQQRINNALNKIKLAHHTLRRLEVRDILKKYNLKLNFGINNRLDNSEIVTCINSLYYIYYLQTGCQ